MSFLKGLAHVGIPVSNMEVSKAFYLDLLGCTLDFETFIPRDGGQSTHVTLLRLGDLCLELVGGYGAPLAPSAKPGPLNHLAIRVKNLAACADTLAAQGIVFETKDPIRNPHLLENGAHYLFFAGPDGERLELFESFSAQ